MCNLDGSAIFPQNERMAARESASAGRRRAARAVAARRGELGMSRQELAQDADVDPKTLYNLENKGRWPIAVTRSKIEKALRWPSGEMEHIASEAEPEQPKISGSLLREIMNTDGLTPGERQAVIDAIERGLRGEQVFPAAEPERRRRPASLSAGSYRGRASRAAVPASTGRR